MCFTNERKIILYFNKYFVILFFRYAAELHLVHFAQDNTIAVLSILFHLGHPDPLMTKVFSLYF